MTADKEKGNHFHLLFEKLGQRRTGNDRSAPPPPSPGSSEYLKLPNRIGYLTVEKNDPPRFINGDRVNLDNLYLVQPLWENSQPALLLLSPGREPPLINGLPAPPVALLHMKDEVLFCKSCSYAAHVTLFIRPRIGPPIDINVGKKCPVCKTEFLPDSIAYTCHSCGQILHCESTAHSNKDSLNCAKFCGNCPICLTPIQQTDGYAYLPEFFRKDV
jgi:hypothetical protein